MGRALPAPSELMRIAWTGTDLTSSLEAEQALLDRYVRTPFTLSHVPIDLPELNLGTERIRTLELNADAEGVPIVWMHGAGAGLGFGYSSFSWLAELGGTRRRVLALDFLGQANSSRPPFPYGDRTGHDFTTAGAFEAALRWFLISLDKWRQALAIDRMQLIAHSTGSFVASHYAIAYPSRVSALVLHSAAGLTRHPAPMPSCLLYTSPSPRD